MHLGLENSAPKGISAKLTVPTRTGHDKAIHVAWTWPNQESEIKGPPHIGISASKTVRKIMMEKLVNSLA
jgi:hypothetical protein